MATRRAPAGPVVLDSSCWLEHFADTGRAGLFAPALASPQALVVPVITIYEVVKKLARELGDEVASQALTLMQQGRVVEIDLALALAATRHGLPLADSLIYATARAHGAELWTQDAHFDGLPGVRFFAKIAG
jgi:predicted nucleic acid-binding protein